MYEIFKNNYRQILAAFSVSIITISTGMNFAWTAPTASILLSSTSPIVTTKTDIEYFQTIYILSGLIMVPINFLFIHKLSRRLAILSAGFIYVAAWLIIFYATNVNWLIFSRILSGLDSALTFSILPTYIAEISSNQIRGALVALPSIFLIIGFLLMYSVAPYVSFFVPPLIGIGFILLHLITFCFMHESPYWLVMTNDLARAKKSLNFFCPGRNNSRKLDSIKNGIRKEKMNRKHILDLFTKQNNLRCIFITVVLTSAQHLTGYSVIIMNIHTILSQEISTFFTPATTGIIFSSVMLFSAQISSLFFDKFGRKKCLLTSEIIVTISLFILGVYYHLNNANVNLDKFKWLAVLGVVIYAIGYKMGIGLLHVVLLSELYPTYFRVYGMTIGEIGFAIFGYLSLKLYQIVEKSFGTYVGFYISAGYTVFAAFTLQLVLPETKGKTLEEIQNVMQKTNVSDEDINLYNV